MGIVERLLDQVISVKIINQVANYAATIIDAIIISSFFGSDAISAYGLVMPVFMLLSVVGGTIANGVSKFCGNSIGSGDIQTTNEVFTSSVIFGIAFSVVPTILLLFFAKPLCIILGVAGAAQGLQTQACDYLRGLAFGVPAYVLMLIMMPILQFNGNRSIMTAAATGMSVLDVAFDLLNVFVVKGGLFGMALASSLSFWFAALMMAASFLKKDRMIRFHFRNFRIRVFFRATSKGFPYVIRQSSNLIRSLGMNNIVVRLLPYDAIAVYSVVSSLQKFIYTPGAGIGDGALTVSSMLYGEEDRQALGRTLKEGFRLSLLMNAIVLVAGICFAPWFVSLYLAPESGLTASAAGALRLAVLCAIPYSVQNMYRGYLQGIDRTKEVLFATVLNELILPLVCSFALTSLFSETGFWLSFTIQEILTVLILFFLIRKRDILMLPAEFGVPDGNRLSMEVKNQEDVLCFSEEVRHFCSRKQEGRGNVLLPALCVEEIGIHILQFGVHKHKKQCEILVYYSEDSWTLRFRDNCNAFDPEIYVKSFDYHSAPERFGLRLAINRAQDVMYLRTMNINNLRIRISC